MFCTVFEKNHFVSGKITLEVCDKQSEKIKYRKQNETSLKNNTKLIVSDESLAIYTIVYYIKYY